MMQMIQRARASAHDVTNARCDCSDEYAPSGTYRRRKTVLPSLLSPHSERRLMIQRARARASAHDADDADGADDAESESESESAHDAD